VIGFDLEGIDGDALLEAALEAGADDAVESEGSIDVITSPAQFEAVKAALSQAGFEPASAEIAMEPSTTVKLTGSEAESMLRVSDALEDLDDVQNVYANFDISEEEMARLAG
jgi:transcriptional/translational regulatory protein YebC/TACO1